MAVNSKFVLGWHETYCRMQIIGLGFVVKYTYAQGRVTKSEDMPRPDARGRGRGRGQHVEAEVEDKISASRTVWPRGLNITGYNHAGGRRRSTAKSRKKDNLSRNRPWTMQKSFPVSELMLHYQPSAQYSV